MALYFFDTYAILEIVFGNRSYEKYKGVEFMTSVLNLFEAHYRVLRDLGAEKADIVFRKYLSNMTVAQNEDFREASFLKWHNRKKKLSMVDCVGFVMSKRLGAVFLTGDREFKSMANVEFVK